MKVLLEIKKEQVTLIRSVVLPVERISYRWAVYFMGKIIASTPWFDKIKELPDNRIKHSVEIQ